MFVGLILLYFVNAAFKIDIFNWEMAIHSAIRFFSGFIFLGVGYFYFQKLSLKIASALVILLIATDDILDYVRNVTGFSAELILHGVYMLTWGSVVGYLTIRALSKKGRIADSN
jgi:hypothetical protein